MTRPTLPIPIGLTEPEPPVLITDGWLAGPTNDSSGPLDQFLLSTANAPGGGDMKGTAFLVLELWPTGGDRIREVIDVVDLLKLWAASALERSKKPAPDSTLADYWRRVHGEAAVWRTSVKKAHVCSNHGRLRPPAGCVGDINIGDRYFDTGEVVDQWRTAKLCAPCAQSSDPDLKETTNA